MANPKLATTDYVDGEVAKKQGYFADVSVDETTGNRELSLKDATDNVVGQIIAQKEGGVLLKDVATPTEATDGANKGYADNNFANALKGTASSVSVRLDDVSPIEHILGVKVSSKNLIPYPYPVQSSTINGITYTNNADGSVTAVGTATGNSIYATYTASANFELEPGTYTFSDDLVGISNITYWSEVRGATDDTVLIQSYATNRTFTITEKTKLRMNLRVVKGQTVDITFKPHLVKGTATTPFSSYVSDLTTISVTRLGKNLIPYPYTYTTKTLNGITFTDNADGSISLSGTSTGQATFYFMYETLNLKQGVTYTLSTSGNYSFGGTATFYIYDSAQGQTAYILLLTDTSTTFTPTKDVNNTNCYLVVPKNRTVSGTLKIQLELGSTATEYELYKTPTESTPTADGTVSDVKSLYPTTTLMTDTEGAIIEAEYNRDINKAFAELQQAIISLGGNI